MTNEAEPRRIRRTWRRWAVSCFVLLVVVSHPWWLQSIGDYLVAEEPITPADVIVVLGGDHRLQRAAELFEDRTVSEIWVLEQVASYAVSVGILRPPHEMEVEQLMLMGVPEDRIRVVAGGKRDIDDAARMIADAMRESPEKGVLILCHRPHGRNVRLVLESVIGEDSGLRFSVLGVPADGFSEHDWWRSRKGWKETFYAFCDLVFTMVRGVDLNAEPPTWDPDAYEQRLISEHEGAGCHAQQ